MLGFLIITFTLQNAVLVSTPKHPAIAEVWKLENSGSVETPSSCGPASKRPLERSVVSGGAQVLAESAQHARAEAKCEILRSLDVGMGRCFG